MNDRSRERSDAPGLLRRWWGLLEERRPFLWLALVTFLTIIASAIAEYLSRAQAGIPGDGEASWLPGWISPVAMVFFGVGCSIEAAALIELFAALREGVIIARRRQCFLQFFGLKHANSKIAVVVPRFPVQVLTDTIQIIDELIRKAKDVRGDMRNQSALAGFLDHLLPGLQQVQQKLERPDPYGKGKAIKRLRDSDERLLAFADVWTALQIAVAFRDLRLAMPEFQWDDDVARDLEKGGPAATYDALISIGLYSNDLTEKINRDLTIRKSFQLETSETSTGTQDWAAREIRITRRGHSDDPGQWHQFKCRPAQRGGGGKETPGDAPKLDGEYALVSKVQLQKTMVIVLGGILAKGTEILGNRLFGADAAWETIYEWVDAESPDRRKVHGNEFAMAISVNYEGDTLFPVAAGFVV